MIYTFLKMDIEATYHRAGAYWQAGLLLICWAVWQLSWPFLGHPVYTGYAIAAVGVQAIIMTARASSLTKIENIVWVIFATLLLIGEVRVINQDHADQDAASRARTEREQAQFQAMLSQDQRSFAATMQESRRILEEAAEAAYSAKRGAEEAELLYRETTGGESFAYVYPVVARNSDLVQLSIHNDGDEILSQVLVTIRYVADIPLQPNSNGVYFGPNAINIGPLAPHEGRTVPPPEGRIDLDQIQAISPTRTLRIWINAQNAGVQEDLYFRKTIGQWEYRLLASRVITRKKRRKGDVLRNNQWIRILKYIDWTNASKD